MHHRFVVLIVAAAALGAAACGSDTSALSIPTTAATGSSLSPETSASTMVTTTTAAVPATTTTTTTAPPPTTTTTTPPTTTTTTSAPVPPPDSPEGYAFAVFTAWVADDLGSVAALLDPDAAAVLAARPYAGSDLWQPPSCGAAAGSTYCEWEGAAEMLVLRVGNELAAEGGAAVVEARFDPLP